MRQSLYEILALGGRYVFAGLMALIVLRAWRITLVDSRRARTLRRMSPQTGLSGELMVLQGEGKARRGMKYPVIREGMIGSSRRADIRIRHGSVRRRHAYFQLTEAGLSVRTHAGAPMRDGHGRPARALLLPDGGAFSIGDVRLLLVLAEAPEAARSRHSEVRDGEWDDDAAEEARPRRHEERDGEWDGEAPEEARPRRHEERDGEWDGDGMDPDALFMERPDPDTDTEEDPESW